MNYFKFSTYEREDVSLLRAYVDNQVTYLSRLYPETDHDIIRDFVIAEVKKDIKNPKLTMIDYPSCGNAETKTVDLLRYTTEVIRKNIISPAGVVYKPPRIIESFLKKRILTNVAARKRHKKSMFAAASVGDIFIEQRFNYLQAQTKIENNSIPGALGSPFNPIFDKPGYNAITGLARHGIMCGYSHTERMLEGNYYFPTVEHCINYCIILLRHIPKDINTVMINFGMYIPTVDDVIEHFSDSLQFYMHITQNIKDTLQLFFKSLSSMERSFVFYAYCLKTIMTKNEQLFRRFLGRFFDTTIETDPSADVSTIFGFNSDLLALLSSINAEIIQHKPLTDAVRECPDGVRKLISIGNNMQTLLDKLSPVISTFLRIDCDIPDAMSHPKMIRKTVIISDTDSVIFSTQSFIVWYTKKNVSFEKAAYEINGFVVFLLVMTLEQIFARMSTNIGAVGDDIARISMKNEFLYPVMLRTPLPKQYIGKATVQEGLVLLKPKDDIKGLSFRSSRMCSETVEAGKQFVNWLFDTVMRDGHTTVGECFERIIVHELAVIKSLEAGERKFLTSSPVKETYKDPDTSILFNWRLWDEVFRPNFGEFIIPAKGLDLPIIGNGAALYDNRYLERVRAFDESLYSRLVTFLNTNNREVTRLIIPMTLKQVPPILRILIDIRHIVYTNSTPFQVIMRSLGISYTTPNDMLLLSDTYCLAEDRIKELIN